MIVRELVELLQATDQDARVEVVTDMNPFTTWEQFKEVFQGKCQVKGIDTEELRSGGRRVVEIVAVV